MFFLPSCSWIFRMWNKDTFRHYTINIFHCVTVKITILLLIQTCQMGSGISDKCRMYSSFCAGTGAWCCSWRDMFAHLHLDVWLHCFLLVFHHFLFIFKILSFVSLIGAKNRHSYWVFWGEPNPIVASLVKQLLLYLYSKESPGKDRNARFFFLFTPKIASRGGWVYY